MEIAIAVFLGAWLAAASLLAARQLHKDFAPYLDKEEDKQ